jgi:hypothetical protein
MHNIDSNFSNAILNFLNSRRVERACDSRAGKGCPHPERQKSLFVNKYCMVKRRRYRTFYHLVPRAWSSILPLAYGSDDFSMHFLATITFVYHASRNHVPRGCCRVFSPLTTRVE